MLPLGLKKKTYFFLRVHLLITHIMMNSTRIKVHMSLDPQKLGRMPRSSELQGVTSAFHHDLRRLYSYL